MCGIAGFQGWRDDGLLRAMNDRLKHRGPDSDGYFSTPEVSLGMRRLAVIDPAGGDQPLFNEDRSVAVVFNGEIYNYKELRAKLLEKGHRFSTRTDTEVLVHLYEEEGPGLVRSLNGMFAFALWDAGRKSLLLARDPLGVKPLYFAEKGNRLAFASELKALLAWKELGRDISPAAVRAYLAKGSIPAPLSIFRSIQKLRPGEWLLRSPEGTERKIYWSLPAPEAGPRRSGVREEAESLLRKAVESQLVSDVPLGVFLSGGLDSSAVAAFAAGKTGGPLKTFSVGFGPPDEAHNELDKARTVARHFGCDHREFILSPDVEALLVPLVRAFDEPFADSSAVPAFLISRETRKHVTVALTGVGGDELFGGYPRYLGLLTAARLQKWPESWRRAGKRLAACLPDRGGSVNWTGRAKRFLKNLGETLENQYDRWTSFLPPERIAQIFPTGDGADAPPLPASLSPEERASRLAQGDLASYLPSDLLTLTDRTSMAHSLEARVPFCDIPLVEFMARLPLAAKLRGFTLKPILKDILKPLLPAAILSQEKKGFSIPLARWVREELGDVLEDCLNEKRLAERGLFNPTAVTRLRREHGAGRENHADALWGLVMFELWQREYGG